MFAQARNSCLFQADQATGELDPEASVPMLFVQAQQNQARRARLATECMLALGYVQRPVDSTAVDVAAQ